MLAPSTERLRANVAFDIVNRRRTRRNRCAVTLGATWSNWKTGVTRLYIVGWMLWILGVGARTLFLIWGDAGGSLGMALGMFAWLALVLPGLLLIGLRWAIDGFVDPHRRD